MGPNITNETDVKLNNALAMTGVENENHPRPNDCDLPGLHSSRRHWRTKTELDETGRCVSTLATPLRQSKLQTLDQLILQ